MTFKNRILEVVENLFIWVISIISICGAIWVGAFFVRYVVVPAYNYAFSGGV